MYKHNSKGVTGTMSDGAQFFTESMRWRSLRVEVPESKAGAYTGAIEGTSSVRFSYPELQLYGGGGMEGKFADPDGLAAITILPPVVVAVER